MGFLLSFRENGKIFIKTCQTTGNSRTKHPFPGNGKFKNVANYSRTNGNSNKWGFEAEKLAQKTKMGSHLFASVLYIGNVTDNFRCWTGTVSLFHFSISWCVIYYSLDWCVLQWHPLQPRLEHDFRFCCACEAQKVYRGGNVNTPKCFCLIFRSGPYSTSKFRRRFAAGFCCFQKIYKSCLRQGFILFESPNFVADV